MDIKQLNAKLNQISTAQRNDRRYWLQSSRVRRHEYLKRRRERNVEKLTHQLKMFKRAHRHSDRDKRWLKKHRVHGTDHHYHYSFADWQVVLHYRKKIKFAKAGHEVRMRIIGPGGVAQDIGLTPKEASDKYREDAIEDNVTFTHRVNKNTIVGHVSQLVPRDYVRQMSYQTKYLAERVKIQQTPCTKHFIAAYQLLSYYFHYCKQTPCGHFTLTVPIFHNLQRDTHEFVIWLKHLAPDEFVKWYMYHAKHLGISLEPDGLKDHYDPVRERLMAKSEAIEFQKKVSRLYLRKDI